MKKEENGEEDLDEEDEPEGEEDEEEEFAEGEDDLDEAVGTISAFLYHLYVVNIIFNLQDVQKMMTMKLMMSKKKMIDV